MTTTTNLAVTKIEASQAQKEVTANQGFDVFDAALGELAIILSDANYTLSTATVPQEWQYGILKFTGTLTAGRNIVVPTNKKSYVIYNATTGGYALTIKTSAGTGVAVSAGATAWVRSDGTNVVAIIGGGGAGTVTSVGISSTDLSVSGSPITSSGSITLNVNNDAITYAKIQNVSATDKILGRSTSGAGDVEEIACTAAGRALIDDADASAQRTTLGLGTVATLAVDTDGTLAANSDTSIASQKAVVTYVATQLDGRSWKQVVRAATTTNGVLATEYANGQTIDGVLLVTGDRILIKDQSTASENGIYTVSLVGAPTRASDANSGAELLEATVGVSEGTVNADTQWHCTANDPITVGSTSLVWVNISTATTYTADESTLHLTGNQFSLKSGAVAIDTHAATGKTTPVDADELPLVDSAASNGLKKLTWANLKATLKTYFDTLYAPLTQPFSLSGFYPGAPTASDLVLSFPAPSGITTITFAAAISGSSGKAHTAATGTTDFDVRKNATTSANGTSVGTIRFAASGTVPTFIAASGFTLTGGTDWLTVWAPGTPDATLADIGITLYGTR